MMTVYRRQWSWWRRRHRRAEQQKVRRRGRSRANCSRMIMMMMVVVMMTVAGGAYRRQTGRPPDDRRAAVGGRRHRVDHTGTGSRNHDRMHSRHQRLTTHHWRQFPPKLGRLYGIGTVSLPSFPYPVPIPV